MDTVISRIQTYMRKKAETALACHSCTPYSLLASRPGDPFNYAIPDRPLIEGLEQIITELQVYATRRNTTARVQFIEEYAPQFAAALRRAGFGEIWRSRVMAAVPGTLKKPEPIPGLKFKTLTADSSREDLREGWNTNAIGFGEAPTDNDKVIEDFRKELISGRAFTALLDGAPVGATMFTDVRQGVTELVGIATVPAYRRRGIARTITEFATHSAFDSGVEVVFLSTNNEDAARIYERLGFQTAGWLVEFSEAPAERARAKA